MYIHKRLAEIFDTTEVEDGWFGKKHIILFGDLLQLPPVHDAPAYIQLTKEEINKYIGCCGNVNIWNELFSYDELTINMRQKDDLSYSKILSRIRVGLLNESDEFQLNTRKIKFKSSNCTVNLKKLCSRINSLPSSIVCLLPKRDMCETLNNEMLNRISSEEIKLVEKI